MSGSVAPGTDPWARIVRVVIMFGGLFAVSIATIFVVAWLNAPVPPSEPSLAVRDDMGAVAPPGVLLPDDVPPALVEFYDAAQTHMATFEAIPCFCGCEEMLGHRHLGDCFVRPDGSGLEAHALGCGVCLGEAAQVMALIDAGVVDVGEIEAAVVARWGDPYSTTD